MNLPRILGFLALFATACSSDGDAVDLGGVDASAARDLEPVLDATTPVDQAPDEHIDPNAGGGTVDLLSFSVFGDIRPSLPDVTSTYPTAVATAVFQGMAAQHPQFAIGTGDYMFAEISASSVKNQLALLASAETSFTAPIFYAMGNHECNSLSDLNCPNLDESPNVELFLSTLVPWTKVPWYSFIIHTSHGDAKFVFIAANAWTPAQAAWLTQVMAQPSAYTFVVRHQPAPDPGTTASYSAITDSDAIMASYKVTLFTYGHVHEYKHLATNALIAGNAGAPLDAGEYGWVQVQQRADGTVAVVAYSLATGMPIDTWAVNADGTAAP